MKKIITLCILSSFCLYANISMLAAATPTNEALSKINEARLIEQYTSRFIVRLRLVHEEYPDLDDTYIEGVNSMIEKIHQELEIIQKGGYTLRRSEEILEGIIRYMKQVNTELQQQVTILQTKERNEQIKELKRYEAIIGNIYLLNEKIIEIYSTLYLSKEKLDRFDREAIRVIIALRSKNTELKAYQTRKYSSSQEIRTYIEKLIGSIRQDILYLKTLRAR